MDGGALRRSSRPWGPPKDSFADDFIGDQWKQMRSDPKKSRKHRDGDGEEQANGASLEANNSNQQITLELTGLMQQMDECQQNISTLCKRKSNISSVEESTEQEEQLPIDFELGCWKEQMKDCAKKIDALKTWLSRLENQTAAGGFSIDFNVHKPSTPIVSPTDVDISDDKDFCPAPSSPDVDPVHVEALLYASEHNDLIPPPSFVKDSSIATTNAPEHFASCPSSLNVQDSGFIGPAPFAQDGKSPGFLSDSQNNVHAPALGKTPNVSSYAKVLSTPPTHCHIELPDPVVGLRDPLSSHNESLMPPYVDLDPSDFGLEFFNHGSCDELVLKVPKVLTDEGKKEWGSTLVGHFLGRKLPYSLVTKATDGFWSEHGLSDTLATDSGLYFFTFSSVEKRDAILEGGPWFIAGQPIFLRPWTLNITLDKEVVQTVPIWVNLYGIPLEYWNPKGISSISSFLGKPIRVDRMTASRRRISYARVCVEVSPEHDFIKEFDIEAENDDEVSVLTKIRVEYHWTPIRCSKCSKFGHNCSNIAKPTFVPIHSISKPYRSNFSQTHNRNKTKAEVGVWKVVTNSGKGEQINVESSHNPQGKVPQAAPQDIGNRFSILSQEPEEVVHRSEKNEVVTLHSARIACSDANSSSHTSAVHEPVGEVGNYFQEVEEDEVEEDELEEEFNTNYEDASFNPESSMSSKKKKKAAKANFRGSHHKGRRRQ